MLLRILPIILFSIAANAGVASTPISTTASSEPSSAPLRTLFTTGRADYSAEYVSECLDKIMLMGAKLDAAPASIPDGSLIIFSFGVMPDGALKSITIKKNNGGPELERVTREAISRAAPFPPFTEFLAQRHSDIVITRTIQYHAPSGKEAAGTPAL